MSSSNQAQTKAEIQAKRDEFMDLLNEYIMQEVSYTLADGAQATEAKKHFDWKRRKAHKAILEFVFPAKEETETEATPAYESLKAENAKLEAMLDAVGAGGVGQSIKPQIQADTAPQPTLQPLTDEKLYALYCEAMKGYYVSALHYWRETEAHKFARAIEAAVANQPPPRQPLTVETFTKLAHRMATKYTHRSDPSFAGYAFLPHTLEQFVRAIEAAHGITGSQP